MGASSFQVICIVSGAGWSQETPRLVYAEVDNIILVIFPFAMTKSLRNISKEFSLVYSERGYHVSNPLPSLLPSWPGLFLIEAIIFPYHPKAVLSDIQFPGHS